MTAVGAIRGALDLLGPNGENWVQDVPGLEGDSHQHCVLSALGASGLMYEREGRAWAILADEAGCKSHGIWVWNDDPHTTFGDVQLTLKRALHRAEEEGL